MMRQLSLIHISLYYDAMNEKGVAMAGLNFVGNAVYAAIKPDVELSLIHIYLEFWLRY